LRKFGLLILNESIKLFARRNFSIAAGVLVAMSIGFAFLFRAIDPTSIKSAADYAGGMMHVSGIGQFLAFIVIILTAGIVAREHNQGTIKFLLIRPRSRSLILASKYVTVLLCALLLTVLSLAVSYVTGGFVFGFQGGGLGLSDILRSALYSYIFTIIYTTVTFLVGILSRSTGAALGVGLFSVTLSGLTIPRSFYKYVLFVNSDLSVYDNAGPPLPGMSLGFSAGMLTIYGIVLLAVGFLVFRKRDVA
jgi:ABC-2 type transport system permease protein